MFERIRKAFSSPGKSAAPRAAHNELTPPSSGPVSEWAATQGLAFVAGGGQSFALKGQVAGRPWRMELGRPSRQFIEGEELRARAELGISEDIAVMVMNRVLKEQLEKQAYARYTDDLQTMADPNLPEEMRWLAMYEEIGWDSMPRVFWARYAIIGDNREHALAWVDQPLARQLLDWPEPGPGPQVPFMLLLLRGKAYLRMQYEPPEMATVQHATAIFTSACDAAIGAFQSK